ncbi:MAG TPA: NUDIX hydrolase [Candidatus Paceibacterota bacterium]|nr:NUDIX hydrolase [Candidatus Paceibacterota bacterium]
MESDIPEFGTKRENEERRDGGCGVVFDPEARRYAVNRLTADGLLGLPSGGVDAGEDIQAGVLREVTEETGLDDFLYVEKIAEALTHYRNILKDVNRVAHATCFLVVLKSTHRAPVRHEAHEKFTLAWATPDEIAANWRERNGNHDHDHWFWFFEKAVARARELGYDQERPA